MMENLVNLCLGPFVSSVECSSVSVDGYSAANLTSTDPNAHSRGFRVEHFIRPPVSILIEFNWPVNIASILIKPALEADAEMRLALDGCHLSDIDSYQYNLHYSLVTKGTHVLIHLKNKSFDRKWDKKIEVSRDVVALVKGSHVKANEIEQFEVVEQPLRHINIASKLKQLRLTVTRLSGVKPLVLNWIEVWGTLSDSCNYALDFKTAVESLELRTHSIQPRISLYSDHNVHHLNQTHECTGSTRLIESREGKTYNCTGLELQPSSTHSPDSLNIVCTKPISNDAPARICSSSGQKRKREISFPDASYHYPNTKRQRMEESVTTVDSTTPSSHMCNQQTLKVNASIVNNTTSTQLAANHSGNSSSFGNMPIKLLDSITYEVMLIPMSLPSGHFVDRSTVDKLANNDALYGRAPTDPFTGVAFTEYSKPQFCPELKLEIDEFLTASGGPGSTELYSDCTLLPLVGTPSRTVGTAVDISRHLTRKEIVSCRPNERAHPVSEVMASSPIPSGGPHQQSSSSDQRGCQDNSRGRGKRNRGVKKDASGSFENELSGSLDEALEKLFNN